MTQQLTEVGQGLSLDDAVQIIYGNGSPGSTPETDSAKVGSSYSDIATGAKWQKISNVSGTYGWLELAGKDAAIMVQHIASTGVILDQVPTQLATEFAWMVTAYNEADPANKYSAIIHMSHNGTATTDATNVNFDASSILRQGPKIGGLSITGSLTGAGATQFMNLYVSSNTMTTFIAYRMVKNISGSNTVVLGGVNLDNHVADGTAHLTTWQNTLLDGVSQSLTSAQVNFLVGVTSPLQAQIADKAASASLATVATSGSYADLSGKPTIPTVPTVVSAFTNDSGYQNAAQVNSAITAATPSWGSLTGKPTFATVATSGSYTDLTNKPAALNASEIATALGYTPYDGATNPNSYVPFSALASNLPVASAGTAGVVKVGSGLSMADGVLSATATATTSTASITTWTGTPYDVAFPVYGAPVDGEVVFRFRASRSFTMPSNLAGSFAISGVAATGACVFSVQKNGTQVATISFAAAGTSGTFSTQAAITFSVGDKVTVVAPATADATLADIDFTIPATLA